MAYSLVFKLNSKALNKRTKDGKSVYTATANTLAVDRDKEVVLPRGVITENFMKNPVMLHIHDYRQVPVGRVTEIRVEDETVDFDFEFADTEDGTKLASLYESGFMNAFSVGFYPKAFASVEPDEETGEYPDSLDLEVADGSQYTLDLKRYKGDMPRGVIPKWELLEISPVPVPSNPEALLQRSADTIVRKYVGSGHSKAAGQILEARLSSLIKNIKADLETFEDPDTASQLSNVIPKGNSSELIHSEEWDDLTNLSKVAVWATEDGSGDKEKLDWGKFSQAFGWVDLAKSDHITSYRFLHHGIKEGNLIADMAGVRTALVNLIKNKDQYSESDFKGVYDHLAGHYEDAGLVVPDAEKSYSDDELEKIRKGESLEVSDDDVTDPTESDDKPESKVDFSAVSNLLTETVDVLKSSLSEIEATQKVRLNIITDLLREINETIGSIKSVVVKSDVDEDEDETDDNDVDDKDSADVNKVFSSLTALRQRLEKLS